MPPRYAYWTILIDGKATAFRAKESEELLPTLNQLRRKNDDVKLRYFSRGKLWDSPEQALWAAKNAGGFGEKRGADWRPGGTHKDPRARFDKKRKANNSSAAGSRDTGASAKRDDRRPVEGDSRPSRPPGPFARDHKSGWTPKPDRPRENNRPPKSFTDRDNRGSRGPAKPFTSDRGEGRPAPKPRHDGDRPWSGKPREQDRRPAENEGRSEGRRPWTPKPRTEGDRPWTGKPGGRPPRSPKVGMDARHGQKPDYQNRGENRPREDRENRSRDDRSPNERPWNTKRRDEGRRPWADGSRSGPDQSRGASGSRGGAKPFHGPKSGAGGWSGKPARKPWTPKPDRGGATGGPPPPATERPRREDWRTRPDRPGVPERPDGRRDLPPKPAREDRPDRPPSAEKIVTKPKPPERG